MAKLQAYFLNSPRTDHSTAAFVASAGAIVGLVGGDIAFLLGLLALLGLEVVDFADVVGIGDDPLKMLDGIVEGGLLGATSFLSFGNSNLSVGSALVLVLYSC